jgi:hypothetical protein
MDAALVTRMAEQRSGSKPSSERDASGDNRSFSAIMRAAGGIAPSHSYRSSDVSRFLLR